LERDGSFDLEALESAAKGVILRCGAVVLERLLEHEDGSGLDKTCACGGTFSVQKTVEKTITTVMGRVMIARTYQRCGGCGNWRVPEDVALDVEKTGFSPGLRRMMAMTGAELCFDKARDMIRNLAGIEVTDKDVERIAEAIGADVARKEEEDMESAMADELPASDEKPPILYIAPDGTGVPVLKRETEGRKGKGADGTARTREVKLGAIFTQTSKDKKGNPLRDPFSTSYVGKIENAEEFGKRLYTEAQKKGLANAKRVVVIGDGATWLWNLADEHFGKAIQILDYYHASEHLCGLAKILHPEDELARKKWLKPLLDYLWNGKIEKVLAKLRSLKLRGKKKKITENTINYFKNNKDRMRYDEYRKMNLFIGSGVVEAGCKSVIGSRLKQSGMHWSVRGANSIIALRCCIESGNFESYWESRRAA